MNQLMGAEIGVSDPYMMLGIGKSFDFELVRSYKEVSLFTTDVDIALVVVNVLHE